jgi:hypothetical protein
MKFDNYTEYEKIMAMANMVGVIPCEDENREWRIFVNDNEKGHRPHFHLQLYNASTNKSEFDTKISIEEPVYVDGGKAVTAEVRDELAWFLAQPKRGKRGTFNTSNWAYLADLWDGGINNEESDVEVMPDYNLLPVRDYI